MTIHVGFLLVCLCCALAQPVDQQASTAAPPAADATTDAPDDHNMPSFRSVSEEEPKSSEDPIELDMADFMDYDINNPLGFSPDLLVLQEGAEQRPDPRRFFRSMLNTDNTFSRIDFGSLDNKDAFSYQPEQQQTKMTFTMKTSDEKEQKEGGMQMGSYTPEQQEIKEISKTLNPALTSQFSGGDSSMNLLGSGFASKGSDDYLIRKEIRRYVIPSVSNSKIHISTGQHGASSDMAKALYLMQFLNTIKQKMNGGAATGSSQTTTSFDTNSQAAILNMLTGKDAKKLTPIIRFIAVQKTSPVNHWTEFMQRVQQDSSDQAYNTLIKQITFENRRQQHLVGQLRKLRALVKSNQHCIRIMR